MLPAKGHKASKCCSLDSNPDGPNSRVTDLKLHAGYFFVVVVFNYLLSFIPYGEHIHKQYVILPLNSKVGLIISVFSTRKTSFEEVIA